MVQQRSPAAGRQVCSRSRPALLSTHAAAVTTRAGLHSTGILSLECARSSSTFTVQARPGPVTASPGNQPGMPAIAQGHPGQRPAARPSPGQPPGGYRRAHRQGQPLVNQTQSSQICTARRKGNQGAGQGQTAASRCAGQPRRMQARRRANQDGNQM
jgi:hypothetical protein